MKNMNILTVIPARSGSKSIPDKNILSINGKPLMAYSIEQSLSSKFINRTIVSTDSIYYSDIAKSFGAEIPFIRPESISHDFATDFDVFNHVLGYLKERENYFADIVVHLRPTSPFRDIDDIDNMIQLLIQNKEWDSIRSVTLAPETPFKMWFMQGGVLKPVVIDNEINEAYNQPRQKLPKVYLQNASIDITRGTTVLNKKSMTGDIIGSYIMDTNYDIDYYTDLNKLSVEAKKEFIDKTFCFDIDGVVANLSPNNDYSLSTPNKSVIEKINKLYDNNNIIILFTARGSKTGIDWSEVTKKQMSDWGVKYHQLKFGKPAADYYIDDRLISINQL